MSEQDEDKGKDLREASLRASHAIKVVRELFGDEDPINLRPVDVAERVIAHIRKSSDPEAIDVLCIIMYMQFQDGHYQAVGRPYDVTKMRKENVH